MTLRYYKTYDDQQGDPVETLCLRGCEVTPDVLIAQQRYGIKLEVPTSEGMSEFHIRCNDVSY